MNELKVKTNFTNIYTQDSPYEYLKEMNRLEYSISDFTKPLYNTIIKQLEKTLSRSINILDLGSSYGINSALMKYNLTMLELNNFFLTGTKPTKKETVQFYEECKNNINMNFYQIDISKEALKFSQDMNLCERGMNVDLETKKLNLLESLPKMDIVIATGCVGYIGYKAFLNLLKIIKNRELNSKKSKKEHINPIFAFSVLRMFDINDIKEVFERYDYSLVKSDIKPIHQRNFSGVKEKEQTISLLHEMKIDTKKYEDVGNFYADFYIARSKNRT